MMLLNELIRSLNIANLRCDIVKGLPNQGCVKIKDVTCNSSEVTFGCMFVCIRGRAFDGHDFAREAMAKGAIVLLCDHALDIPITQIIVDDVRKSMGYIAAMIYDNPASKLKMIAVTGTNGKSTTTYMIRSILETAGIKTGLIGTIVYSDGDKQKKADRTTPESTEVQRLLAQMVQKGCDACVMEASSHGLSQGRLNGCSFDVGIFTNLTPEHLDYHGTMEDYYLAKKKLYSSFMRRDWNGAANADDVYGQRLITNFKDHMMSYGLEKRSEEVSATEISMTLDGITFDLHFPDGSLLQKIEVPITGEYNVYNSLAAVCAADSLGISHNMLRLGLKRLPQVPGRLERYRFENGAYAIVDYAHTPDALANVLSTLRDITQGRIISVFGLGGERYAENRPLMGRIAAEIADHIVITMDNPRSENPEEIALQIAQGIEKSPTNCNHETIIDREQAVFHALNLATTGDVVVITGKGPEEYILWGKNRIPYNDSETIKTWADKRFREWQ